jgi:protein phosphatase
VTGQPPVELSVGDLDASGDAILGDRSGQEDCLAITRWHAPGKKNAGGLLVALADGMGGHSSGEVASQLAVSAATKTFLSTQGEIAERLNRACQAANAAIAEERARNPQLNGMGSTLVLAVVDAEGVQWVSVGDSPLWRWRKGGLQRLNRDHSMAPVLDEMAERGEISREEAASDPRRGHLRSALTGGELALVDASSGPVAVGKGDSIVVASDGLLALSPRDVARRLKSGKSPRKRAGLILRDVRAARREGLDNSSIAIVTRRPGFLGIF